MQGENKKTIRVYAALFLAVGFFFFSVETSLASNISPADAYYTELILFKEKARQKGNDISFLPYAPAKRADVLSYLDILGGENATRRISILQRKYDMPVNLIEALKYALDGFKITYDKKADPWYEDIVRLATEQNIIPPGIAAPHQKLTKAQLIATLVRAQNAGNESAKIERVKMQAKNAGEANVLGATTKSGIDASKSADEGRLAENLLNMHPTEGTSALPIYYITLDDKERKTLFSRDNDDTFLASLIQDDGSQHEIKINRRGNSSRNLPKKSFTVKFQGDGKTFHNSPRFVEDDYFEGSKRIVLNAEYRDPSLARSNLAYRLFRHLADGNMSPHVFYIHLYINYEYQGIYAATELVDEYFLTRNGRKLEGGLLYKMEDVSAGFNNPLSMRRNPDLFFENVVEKKYPEDNDHTEFMALVENINNLEGEEFMNFVMTDIDMDSLVDWLILVAFTAHDDGMSHNFFIYKNSSTARWEFIPWDFDASFGREWDTRKIKIPWKIEERAIGKNVLIDKLWKFPEFKKRFKDRAQKYIQSNTIHPKRIAQLLENIMTKVRQDIAYDERLWHIGKGKWVEDLERFNEEMPLMKASIDTQYRYLRALN